MPKLLKNTKYMRITKLLKNTDNTKCKKLQKY